MRRPHLHSTIWLLITALTCASGSAQGGVPGEGVETFCEGTDSCVDDTLEIIFENESNVLEDPGEAFLVRVVTETVTENVGGWSYAVAHDAAVLELVEDSPSIADTDAEAALVSPFFDTTLTVEGGFISAVVLSFVSPATLGVGRNTLLTAEYSVIDAAALPTRIEFRDGELANPPSPPVTISLTVDGQSRQPASLHQGIVTAGGGGPDPVCEALPGTVFCESADNCIDSTLEIVFGDNISDGPRVLSGPTGTFAITVVSETESEGVNGWSYGVAHDPAVLGLQPESPSIAGTDGETALVSPFFDTTRAVEGGFISAVVLSFVSPASLSTGRNRLATASYDLLDAAALPTAIEFRDGELANPPSPPVTISLTVDGQSRRPTLLIPGQVCASAPSTCPPETGGDPDRDEVCSASDNCPDTANPDQADCDDDGVGDVCDDDVSECEGFAFWFGSEATSSPARPDAAGLLPISLSNSGPVLAFQLGVSTTEAGWTLSDAIGTSLALDLEIVEPDGTTHCTEGTGCDFDDLRVGNVADVPLDLQVVEALVGSALTGGAADTFLALLDPALGGPGFAIAWVACLDSHCAERALPPSTETLHEIAVIRVSGNVPDDPEFLRGDANGNGTLEVTDAILALQFIAGNVTRKTLIERAGDCFDSLDSNDNGRVEIVDVVPVLRHLFQGAPPLAPPSAECGTDPTTDDLDCAGSSFCSEES